MPELPEVETVRRGLEQTIMGKTVKSIEIRVRKLFPDDQVVIDTVLVGQKVRSVKRRAKLLLVELSSGWTLVVHLKMTGQLVVTSEVIRVKSVDRITLDALPFTRNAGFVGGHPEKAYEQQLPHKHTHIIITFTDGTTLYFNDLRKFGWFRLFSDRPVPGSPITIHEFLASLKHGPEPLGPDFTLEYFQDFLKHRTTVIKTLLLDQAFIAGIGNIYADEALFAAAIRPTRRAKSISKAESNKLFHSIRQVLELGIEYGGTSFNSYRNVQGTAGKMREHLKVYGREGQACLRCGDRIVRKKIGQRSAHYCPSCQR